MRVKDDDEKRHYDVEPVLSRSNVGGHERNGAVLLGASAQSSGGASSQTVDSRPHFCRVIGSSHRRGHHWLWRQRPGRATRLRCAILALAHAACRSGLSRAS